MKETKLEERDAHTPESPQAREDTDAGSDARTEEEIGQMRSLGSQIPNPSLQNPIRTSQRVAMVSKTP